VLKARDPSALIGDLVLALDKEAEVTLPSNFSRRDLIFRNNKIEEVFRQEDGRAISWRTLTARELIQILAIEGRLQEQRIKSSGTLPAKPAQPPLEDPAGITIDEKGRKEVPTGTYHCRDGDEFIVKGDVHIIKSGGECLIYGNAQLKVEKTESEESN
jgi:hypothetical protein